MISCAILRQVQHDISHAQNLPQEDRKPGVVCSPDLVKLVFKVCEPVRVASVPRDVAQEVTRSGAMCSPDLLISGLNVSE
jgi:hypothetical protein